MNQCPFQTFENDDRRAVSDVDGIFASKRRQADEAIALRQRFFRNAKCLVSKNQRARETDVRLPIPLRALHRLDAVYRVATTTVFAYRVRRRLEMAARHKLVATASRFLQLLMRRAGRVAAGRNFFNASGFRHAEDIINLHDNLQALMNVEDAERRRFREMADAERKKELEKKFKKLQEDRIAKFECTGEKYSMLVPHDLAEITTEGQSLHHCVGGYLDRHAQGQTNIIFLRQNSVPTVPFYTIEVDNSGNVIQIHGLYNRWLGNDPDAISFVWKWIQDRGFKCEKYKLLNTGAGYGQGKDEVSETYLVA